MNPRTRRFLFYLAPAFLYALLIFILSSMTHVPEIFPSLLNFDKILHLAEYFIFGYLLMRAFITSPKPALARRAALMSIIAGCLYGLSDEWHQSFVPGRDASLWDALSDTLGIMAAVLMYGILRERFLPLKRIEDRMEKGT